MLLEVRNLRVAFRRDGREIVPVRDVSFTVPEHGRVALVGESGCGKSLTALSLRRLSPTSKIRRNGFRPTAQKRGIPRAGVPLFCVFLAFYSSCVIIPCCE